MNSKVWYKSKTMRFSVLLAGLGLAIISLPQFDLIVAAIPVEYAGVAAILLAGIQAALRAVTDTEITLNPPKDE